VVWFFFAIVTPYMLSHRPGTSNPSFFWYVTYQTAPVLVPAIVVML